MSYYAKRASPRCLKLSSTGFCGDLSRVVQRQRIGFRWFWVRPWVSVHVLAGRVSEFVACLPCHRPWFMCSRCVAVAQCVLGWACLGYCLCRLIGVSLFVSRDLLLDDLPWIRVSMSLELQSTVNAHVRYCLPTCVLNFFVVVYISFVFA